eukprot:gene12814-14127_t
MIDLIPRFIILKNMWLVGGKLSENFGIKEMGLSEAIIKSISSAPLAMQPHLYMNIVVTGGNVSLPGFVERITNDVRSLAPIDFDVEIESSDNPSTFAWQGGAQLSKEADFVQKYCVTKAEYEEHGRGICSEKFEGM